MPTEHTRHLTFQSEGSLQGAASNRFWSLLSHAAEPFEVSETVSLGPSPAGPEDIAIANRLLGVFLRMMDYQQNVLAPQETAASGIWEMSRHAFHGDFYALAAKRNVEGIADYMRNAMQTKLTHGLGPGQQVFDSMATDEGGLQTNVILILDRFASLAESLGINPIENPEQGRWGAGLQAGAAGLVRQIETSLNYSIGRPPVMGAFGIKVGDQILDARQPDDVYCAERIKTVMATHDLANVAEIGGGLGGCAMQAIRAGLGSYTIFDLPVVLLVQGWLLMKVFGTDSVEMFTENAPKAFIFLRPYWEFSAHSRDFGLVFNRDSLPEIPRQHAMAYINEMATSRCSFLSVNQEAQGPTDSLQIRQLWVHDLMRQEPRFRCIARHPYWHRRGYSEELFIPRNGNPVCLTRQ